MPYRLLAVAAFFLCLLVPSAASAQSVRLIGDFRDWSAYSAVEGAGNICFALSKPVEVTPQPDGFTAAYLYLTHRPAELVTNEINVVAGFAFAPDTPATLTISGDDVRPLHRGRCGLAARSLARRDSREHDARGDDACPRRDVGQGDQDPRDVLAEWRDRRVEGDRRGVLGRSRGTSPPRPQTPVSLPAKAGVHFAAHAEDRMDPCLRRDDTQWRDGPAA